MMREFHFYAVCVLAVIAMEISGPMPLVARGALHGLIFCAVWHASKTFNRSES